MEVSPVLCETHYLIVKCFNSKTNYKLDKSYLKIAELIPTLSPKLLILRINSKN